MEFLSFDPPRIAIDKSAGLSSLGAGSAAFFFFFFFLEDFLPGSASSSSSTAGVWFQRSQTCENEKSRLSVARNANRIRVAYPSSLLSEDSLEASPRVGTEPQALLED